MIRYEANALGTPSARWRFLRAAAMDYPRQAETPTVAPRSFRHGYAFQLYNRHLVGDFPCRRTLPTHRKQTGATWAARLGWAAWVPSNRQP